MKTSRAVFSEIQKKAGPFPFTLRALDDEKRARMGVQEAVAHGLLRPYDITQTAAGTIVAEFFFTSESLRYTSARMGKETDERSRFAARWTSPALPRSLLVLCVSI